MSGEERRAEIVDAAARAIVARGVGGFRVRDVADEAGVSQPLVSTHFRSREELVLAAFVRADELAMGALEARAAHAATARERLRIHLVGCIDDGGDPVVAQSFQLWHELWTHGLVAETLRQAVVDRERAWIDRIEALILEARAEGGARTDVDAARAALFFNTLIDGLGPSLRYELVDLETAFALLDDAMRDRLGP